MRDEHLAEIARAARAARASTTSTPGEFRRYGSARTLYHFNVDNAGY